MENKETKKEKSDTALLTVDLSKFKKIEPLNTYDKQSRGKRVGKEKPKTSWIALTLLVLFSAFVLFALDTLAWADTVRANCPKKGCTSEVTVKHHTNYEYGTKEYWWSFCTNLPEECIY